MKQFYGHGKLLLTGEYAVLDGANALAIPTRFGQKISINSVDSDERVLWNSYEAVSDKRWLFFDYDWKSEILSPKIKGTLKVLHYLKTCKPELFTKAVKVETHLEFPTQWGLGSSSTLIYCLAQWADVNAFELLENTFGGSGYDVACAGSNKPIFYTNENTPTWDVVDYNPTFKEHLYFVYLGKKMNSRKAIKHYRAQESSKNWLNKISGLTSSFLEANSLKELEEIMEAHEYVVSERIKTPKVKEVYFEDYWGSVKSLGAWGGDFVLMTNNRSRKELEDYLKPKNMETIFTFEEMIL